MSKISNQTYYPAVAPVDGDFVIGTDVSDASATKTFLFSDIKTYIGTGLSVSSSLSASSTSNQDPSTTDTILQVEFGAAQGTSSDAVQIDAAGTVTFNQTGLYFVNFHGSFQRDTSSNNAYILLRKLVNDSASGFVRAVEIRDNDTLIPHDETFPITVTAPSTTLKFQIVRDSGNSGADDGGLHAVTTASSFADAPSASVEIWKLG